MFFISWLPTLKPIVQVIDWNEWDDWLVKIWWILFFFGGYAEIMGSHRKNGVFYEKRADLKLPCNAITKEPERIVFIVKLSGSL